MSASHETFVRVQYFVGLVYGVFQCWEVIVDASVVMEYFEETGLYPGDDEDGDFAEWCVANGYADENEDGSDE